MAVVCCHKAGHQVCRRPPVAGHRWPTARVARTVGLAFLIFQAGHRAFEMLESEDMTVVVQAVVLLLWHLVMNEMAWVVGEVAAL